MPHINELRQVREGTLDWVRANAGFLDSPQGIAQLPAVPRAKALIQLAGMHRGWQRIAPEDPRRAAVAELVRRVWHRPELPQVIATEPRYKRQYSLMYCALAPDAGGPRGSVLQGLATDGYLSTPVRSPYLGLEIAYYARMAGVEHGSGSARDLYARSMLAAREKALPVTDADACTIAHTIFYLSDYGLGTADLERAEIRRVRSIVLELTAYYAQQGDWSNVAKFLLVQYCLGLDPRCTASGAAGITALAAVQEPSGEIPCASAGLAPGADETWTQRFRKAYQTTLITALMSLMVSSAAA